MDKELNDVNDIPAEHRAAYACSNVKDALVLVGINMTDENFKDTPKRWVKALLHYLQPFDAKDVLAVGFDAPVKEVHDHAMVVQTDIPYRAMCAHHLLPVIGVAHVGYIPTKRVVGLSKLARLVYGISHRMPSLQEDVGNAIVDELQKHLEPVGAMCVISAEHGCMFCRGVEESGISTVTSSVRGAFINDAVIRNEFYELVRLGKK